MKDCTSPEGHQWRATSFTTLAGSTPVECAREDCDATGFELSPRVCTRCEHERESFRGHVCDWCADDLERLERLAQNPGHRPTEEPLF